jgi:SPOR domain
VRAIFLILLVANLLFLAWARWIDTPSDASAQDALARLPRLQLVTELPPGSRPTSATLTPAEDQGAALRAPESLATEQVVLRAADAAAAEKIALRAGDAAAPAVSSVPTVSSGSAPVAAATAAPSSCTSVGPFNDIAHAARAAGLLTQRGFHLQQRAEEGETIEGYWVFVGDLQTDAELNQAVERLDKSGFTDAHVMKNYSTNRRISVGMFSTRERAEKRAAAVRAIGLEPEVGERKFPGTVYWVDVALTSRAQKPPPEYLFADIGHAKVQVQPCPAGLRPVAPGVPQPPAGNEDGVSKPLPRTTVASAPVKH